MHALKYRTVPVRTKPANTAGWRLFVASLALIAFAFQSYVTQTHIHFAAISVASAGQPAGEIPHAGKSVGGQLDAPKNKTPSNDDPLKCPLCQAVGYAGHFVAPSAVAPLLPFAAISILPLAISIASSRGSPSHIWQGRGPPNS